MPTASLASTIEPATPDDRDRQLAACIANYLEDAYPDRPSLFGGEGGRAMARMLNWWGDIAVVGGMFPFIVADIFGHLRPQDQDYFRTSREARFGKPLEQVQANRDVAVVAFAPAAEQMVPDRRHAEKAGGLGHVQLVMQPVMQRRLDDMAADPAETGLDARMNDEAQHHRDDIDPDHGLWRRAQQRLDDRTGAADGIMDRHRLLRWPAASIRLRTPAAAGLAGAQADVHR